MLTREGGLAFQALAMQSKACMILMWMLMMAVAQEESPLLMVSPPSLTQLQPMVAGPSRSSHRSIETLVVVLAVIIIVGVIAGVFARVCGGRHLAGSGEHDIEGWVERKCASCIDGGVPATVAPPLKATPEVEEEKK
ncbi:uncharacterized protein LOC131222507 [Magnolia sinica]|uniref:uncharacterized protein LOC131222507 n=1 Tax=Magnolia sinica TaxID=86752 RepID=UPI0026582974|nr:uncharacterized protein LOC131222507 [Magnolia sinica]